MLTLLLLRHAKSDWTDTTLDDFDRALAPRGIRARELIAQYMVDNDLIPDRVLCSTARRARHTLTPLLDRVGTPLTMDLRQDLYHQGDSDYLSIVNGAGPANTLLIVAHNPATALTAARLAGSGDPELRAEMAMKYPTAALTEIVFPVDSWADVTSGSGRLVRFVKPRDLIAGEAAPDQSVP